MGHVLQKPYVGLQPRDHSRDQVQRGRLGSICDSDRRAESAGVSSKGDLELPRKLRKLDNFDRPSYRQMQRRIVRPARVDHRHLRVFTTWVAALPDFSLPPSSVSPFRENVRLTVHRLCPIVTLPMATDDEVVGLATVPTRSGTSAARYFLTVLLEPLSEVLAHAVVAAHYHKCTGDGVLAATPGQYRPIHPQYQSRCLRTPEVRHLSFDRLLHLMAFG